MAAVETKLNILEESVIEVTEIISKGLGEGDIEALFKCKVKWHPQNMEKHVAALAEEELTSVDEITVRDWSREHITPGTYRKIDGAFEKD